MRLRRLAILIFLGTLTLPGSVLAGAQQYEPLSAAVQTALAAAIADERLPKPRFDNIQDRLAYLDWLAEMSDRLKRRKSDYQVRRDFLETVYYEAKRAGLEPALVLGLIQVESNFRRHAVSVAGARGYMQVMPFWSRLIGDGDTRKLFDMRVNIRFGCIILRHYLDIERGNLYRALGRYNGSLGRAHYPNLVLGAWKKWEYQPRRADVPAAPAAATKSSATVPAGATTGRAARPAATR